MPDSVTPAAWIFWFVAAGVAASAQTLPLQIGEMAPPLEAGRILQGQDPSEGARKALLIEFWATWCGPCRETIPHLRELAQEFKDQPIEFVHITDESIETVTAFLKQNQMPGVVATDPDRRMWSAFGIRVLPTTVLLDRSGRIAAVTEALKIARSHLERLLTDTRVDLPDVRISMAEVGQNEAPWKQSAMAHVAITPSTQGMAVNETQDLYRGKGVRLQELLAWAYGVPAARVVVPESLDGLRYDVDAWVPPEQRHALKPLVQAAITAASPIRITHQERPVAAFVIRGLPGKLKPAAQQVMSTRCESGRISAEAGPVSVLQSCLENALNQPVVVEDAPDGFFAFDLRWPAGDSNQLKSTIEREFGVRAQVEQRRMEFIVVSRIPLPGHGK